jgi:hypothetical protein
VANYQLPLSNVPQSFQIALGGKEYILTCKWNDADEGGWVLDFADAITGLAIAANIPLVTGVDILAGLEYLEWGGSLIVFTDGDDFAVPTLSNLGVESNVYFQTEDDVA